jgi:hypothetical protein
MRGAVPEDAPWGKAGGAVRLLVVGEFVEEALDLLGRRETAEHGALSGGEVFAVHSVSG